MRVWMLLLLALPISARYLLIAPERALKGDNYSVTIVNNLNEDADVTLEMSSKGTSGIITEMIAGVVSAKSFVTLNMMVPSTFSNEMKLLMNLTYPQSKLIITNSTVVPIRELSGFMAIQTDKKLYKKNQKVLMRVLALDKELMPVNENVTLYIKNPNGNRVEMWKDLQPESGVVKAEFLLSDDPTLGDWKIFAEQHHSDSEIVVTNATITVDKFVLPRFEVIVDAPPSVFARTQSPVKIRVTAKYTFGENVIGECRLILSESSRSVSVTSQLPLVQGMATFTVQASEIQGLLQRYGSDINVKAIVTEGSSKIELAGMTSMKVTYEALTIEKIGEDYHTDPNPYHYCVTVTDDKGQLIPEVNRSNYQMTISRERDIPVQTLQLSTLPIVDTKHTFCGTINPPFLDQLNLRISISTNDQEGVLQSKDFLVQRLITSANNTAATLSLTVWDVQQNQLSTKNKFGVGEDVQFQIQRSGRPLVNDPVFYQVFSKGESLASGVVDLSRTTMLTVTTTRRMAPSASVLVYIISNGYLVSAMQKIHVKLNLNTQVGMSFGTARAEVASDVTLRVTTPQQNSFVALVAIDKGSQLLGAPNDITESEVLNHLGVFSLGHEPNLNPWGPVERRKRSMFFPPMSYVTEDILRRVGILWMTDVKVQSIERFRHFPDFEEVADKIPEAAIAEDGLVNSASPEEDGSGAVRKSFPETWIWVEGKSGADSVFEIQKRLPDSITSYVTRALVISPSTGLHIPDNTQIESFKEFFMVVSTPPSIIQGEVFEVKVLLFNYIENGPEELQATVSIKSKVENAAKIWSRDSESEPTSSREVTKTLTVKRGESSLLALWVRKLETEEFSSVLTLYGEATAQVNGQAYVDRIEKDISAEPEGRRIQKTKVVSLEAAGSGIDPVGVTFPQEAVKGSKAVYVLVMGDLLTQSLNNPEKMITVPTGCGEQNIATTVPNIYLLQYLRATQAATTLESKIIQNIKLGYQRELNYRRNDGSFSAFGMSDASGSTWLTAFVLKSFAEIDRMLPNLVDPSVMDLATAWLNFQVNDRGGVNEPGRVIHTEMQGSISNSREKLSAFVLSCYAEVVDVYRLGPNFMEAQKKMLAIETLLKGSIPSAVTNPYYSSLLTYALAVDGSSPTVVAKLTQQLMDNATAFLDGAIEMKCLGENCGEGEEEPVSLRRGYINRDSSPSSIEMTGYLILSLMVTNQSKEALPFVRWLNSKRNSLGGWYSTQDTVIGLRALSEFAKGKLEKNKDVQINIEIIAKHNTTTLKTKTFTVNQGNRILLQREQFPVETNSLEIKPSQAGDVVVTVLWQYNLVQPLQDKDIQVTVTKQTISEEIYDVRSCVRYLGTDPSNMALVSITMGTGMTPDVTPLEKDKNVARVEVESSLVHIYLNEITKESQCMQFRATQSTEVKDAKPVPVKAMLYYKPEVAAVVTYDPSTSNRLNYCGDYVCSHAGHVTPLSLSLMIVVFLAVSFITGGQIC
uniref:CD109 antigen-like n=1 Tax=Crassostrea virginica TaxID=6565 RepID=A0A8B8EDJ9_CRAVI|nr:CD109 antigen-like [Crassostrea virginica]XP_022338179.1 CD109 antigen-like [Crassostrea virginica]XP_022338180.1 CD109 antigen-like [Crassostrea virginica]